MFMSTALSIGTAKNINLTDLNVKDKIMKYFKRALILPFVFGILLTTHVLFVFRRTWEFIKYGGEFNQYRKDDRASIEKIYKELKEQQK
jgi:hypothetical protein